VILEEIPVMERQQQVTKYSTVKRRCFSEKFDLSEREVDSPSRGRDNFLEGRRVTSSNGDRQDGLFRG